MGIQTPASSRSPSPRHGLRLFSLASLRLCASALTVFSLSLLAQTVPDVINYQGTLTDEYGANVTDGAYTLTFRIWDTATGGTAPVWGPQVLENVQVIKSQFNVILGPKDISNRGLVVPTSDETTPFTSGATRYLEITVGGQTATPAISPRQRILTVPYAVQAEQAAHAATADDAAKVGGKTADELRTFLWATQEVNSNTTMVPGTAYVVDKPADTCELTLPAVSNVGDVLLIVGKGSTGWRVKSNASAASQRVRRGASLSYVSSNSATALATSGDAADCLWLMCTAASDTWTVMAGEGQVVGNYFGDGTDGDGVFAANETFTVPNKVGSYDGDMVVKHFNNLTINPGVTITVDQPCRGLLIYCRGDCVVYGTISMTARGAAANPGAAGASDNHVVNAAHGLVFRRHRAGGGGNNSDNDLLWGCGLSAVEAEAHQGPVQNGVVLCIPRYGASGAASCSVGYGVGRLDGASGTGGRTGGGASGGIYHAGDGGIATAGAGAQGTCFAGGGSGGSVCTRWESATAGAASPYGGAGGTAAGTYGAAAGGSGNPGGSGSAGGATGTSGVGGIVILIVRGDLTIGSSGVISANGVTGAAGTVTGGGSGGGSVVLIHGGSYANSGTVSAAGGGSGPGNYAGGTGGAGSVQTALVDK